MLNSQPKTLVSGGSNMLKLLCYGEVRMYDILNQINSPKDIKNLSNEELEELAKDVREALLNRVSKKGGHVGPNLGVVEATIALHYVFDFEKDKLVFDVSHQCYPHKILTGRKNGFIIDSEFDNVSGYLNPAESKYDTFKIGHTSTSISLATGVAKARDLLGENYNVVSFIGDGSLSGGEAYEGLNNAATIKGNFIIIVNDNEMSIAENHGGLYPSLARLRESNGECGNNFFKSLGFDYIYEEKGNDIESLIKTFEKVKNFNRPVVVHIHTIKGYGYLNAETSKELWHFRAPFNTETGELKNQPPKHTAIAVCEYLLNKAKIDKSVVVVTAATPGICGLSKEIRDKLGEQYTDVGIAEEHAVAYVSALAKSGAKPVAIFNSSFIQRTYDQLSQELALNNSPAVILVNRGGISAASATHLSVFDIPLVSNIPNLVCLAPTSIDETLSVLDWAIDQKKHPVVIRLPLLENTEPQAIQPFEFNLNKFSPTKKGDTVAIIGLGSFYNLATKIAEELYLGYGISATVINPLFYSGLDTELLENLKKNHKLVVTLEDGVLDGGFGEKISRFYASSDMKVLNFGAKKEFTDDEPLASIYERNNLTNAQIIQQITKQLNYEN